MARKFIKYLFNYSFVFWLFFVSIALWGFGVSRAFAEVAAGSAQATLEWLPNSEPDLAGYRVFSREQGQSYDYTNPSWEGTVTTCTIYNLDDTKTYYFVARAFDTEGLESSDSTEVCLTSGLVQEAEDGILYGAFETASDSAASNGQYVQVPDGFGERGGGPDETHKIEYTFNVLNAGLYQIKGWVYSDSAGSDSFWVKVNGSPTAGYLWDVFQNTGYQTDYANDRYNADPLKVMLDAGINVITIYLREDGTRLDKIELEPIGGNQSPTADAGPDQTADEGQLITLNGSNSTDPDDGIAAYHWVQTGGLPVSLVNPNGQQATFTAPDVGEEGASLTFELTVIDHGGLENTDSCVVNVTRLNEPPQADAGPDQIADEGQLITLNGSNSTDPDDGIAAYHWVQTGGPQVTLSDPDGQQATFTAPDVGAEGATLIFELTVVDHSGIQNTDSCVVNVTSLNEPPEANAGADQTVNEGVVVTLDGSSSLDIDSGIAAFLWTQTSGPSITLSDPASPQPTFTAPNVGPEGASLAFNLTVTDAGGLQDTDSCIVNISWQNQPPTAVVGEEYMEVEQGTVVILDGSGSTDGDDGIASYLWTQVNGTPVSLLLPSSGSAVATFIAPETDPNGSNLGFKLTVTDFGGLQSSADVYVYVTNMAQTDSVTILSVKYAERPKKLTVEAESNAPEGSATLTAWANYGTQKIELGGLVYSPLNKVYSNTFRKIQSVPDTVTVTSSGGGSDTR